MGFATPDQREDGTREFFNLKDHKGSLAVFKVSQHDANYRNNFDEIRPAVRAEVTIIDGDKAGTFYGQNWIEAQYVVDELSKHVNGDPVLARIEKGKRAYFLGVPDADDLALAEQFYSADQPADDDSEPPF